MDIHTCIHTYPSYIVIPFSLTLEKEVTKYVYGMHVSTECERRQTGQRY